MIKFKLYFDKDQETQWLNEMANLGWAMTGFFAGFYRFEECEKGEYKYQIDFGNKFFSVSEDYREFMSEAGIEIVQTWGFWVILRKLASKGAFELYSDVDSQIEHYQKIRKMFKIVIIIELICLLLEIASAAQAGSPLLWGCVFLILAVLLAIVKITLRTGDIINELNERKTGMKEPRNRNVSALLAIGLLFNSCALIIQDHVSSPIKLTVQILAIIFMLVGIYQTAQKGNNEK